MKSVSKASDEESSLSEKPGRRWPRRLADWLNPTGERKVHSLVDKIYKRKNLEVAWEKVKRNRGAGGVDGEDIAAFEVRLEEQLERLHCELKDGTYAPQPVMRQLIPKVGQPGKTGCWGSRRFTIGFASKRCSTGWNRSSRWCSMKPASDTAREDPPRMH
jgi:hypothetical protein